MKIRSVTPTPIVSVSAGNPQVTEQNPMPPAPAAPPRVEMEPMTVDIGGKQIVLGPGELTKVVDKINEAARVFNHTLQFEVAQDHQIVIRVIDTAKGNVVREIPPEKLMDAFERMEAALGLLLDAKL